MKFAAPGFLRNPEDSPLRNPGPAVVFTTAAVPGRSAALDVCVASSIAAAARGDAAQAAFDRKLTHYRNEMGELRQQNIHCRPLVWTADGRPHPAVTRTLQNAADVTSSRNGQHQSAKSLHRRWKHEIQIALLQRRAATARAVLPNLSARAEWLFAGIIDKALHQWGHVPPLDGGSGCTTLTLTPPTLTQHYQVTMTDVVSFERFPQESVQPSCLRWVGVFVCPARGLFRQ